MKNKYIYQIGILVIILLGCVGKFDITNSLESATLLEPSNNRRSLGTKLDNG